MGLLKHLLFWPVTGPSFLTRFSLEKVEGAVRSELTDESAVLRDLMELQLRLDMGDIDDEQYVAEEAELMARLRSVREWREQFGMATARGLVQVARDEEGEAEAPAEVEEKVPEVARSDSAEIEVSFEFEED